MLIELPSSTASSEPHPRPLPTALEPSSRVPMNAQGGARKLGNLLGGVLQVLLLLLPNADNGLRAVVQLEGGGEDGVRSAGDAGGGFLLPTTHCRCTGRIFVSRVLSFLARTALSMPQGEEALVLRLATIRRALLPLACAPFIMIATVLSLTSAVSLTSSPLSPPTQRSSPHLSST